MPFVDGSGTASGGGTASGSGTMHFGVSGPMGGAGTLSPATVVLLLGPSGLAQGVASSLASANLNGAFAGQAAGLATVFGDWRVNASGQAQGVGTLTGMALVVYGGTGIAVGTSTVTGQGGLNLIFTGQAYGTGTLSFDEFVDSDGHASGSATVLGSGLHVITAKGYIFGTSALTFSYPLPIFGQGTLVGFPVVDKVLPAINAIVGPTKCFRYLQLFQRGDLPIYISNHAGPVSPVLVTYTLFQLRPDGSRKQIGPSGRTPVQGVVGEFYATGRAGESGQPGQWVIRWEFQRTFQSAMQCKEMCFQVLDAVLARDPRDVTPRCRKYGWN